MAGTSPILPLPSAAENHDNGTSTRNYSPDSSPDGNLVAGAREVAVNPGATFSSVSPLDDGGNSHHAVPPPAVSGDVMPLTTHASSAAESSTIGENRTSTHNIVASRNDIGHRISPGGSLQPNDNEKHDGAPPAGQRLKRLNWNPWRLEVRKVFLMCLCVTIPMLLFTIIILWLVLGHQVSAAQCPYAELCPSNDTFEGTFGGSYYYVDYPAARLAFVASWSSTVSLSLLGFVTAIYSYFTASRLIRLSTSPRSTADIPSPYQTSILFRLLNAELMVLLHLFWSKVKEVFWGAKRNHPSLEQPFVVRLSIAVLVVGLGASAFIQAADTYLHVTTEAVELTLIEPRSNSVYAFSRGLAPWCLDRATFGSITNVDFWGCGVEVQEDFQLNHLNNTQRVALVLGISADHKILDYTDTDGVPYAIVAPKNVSASTDWQATSIGTSLQCHSLPNDTCVFQSPSVTDFGMTANFSCTKGSDLSGIMYGLISVTYFSDFHRYLHEPPPFEGTKYVVVADLEMQNLAANLTHDEAANIFNNPWHFTAFANLFRDSYPIIDPEEINENVFELLEGERYFMYSCDATVWDLNYTVVSSQVTRITKRLSNSSTTGIVSMPNAQMWGQTGMFMNNVIGVANAIAHSEEEFTQSYKREIARGYATSLATQLSERPALLVQTRSSKIVSKVPKAALWLLVTANLVFAIIAISLTALAISVISSDVHQLRLRMSIAGLTAQLFEGEHAERKVKEEEGLFEEHQSGVSDVKRVGVSRTTKGGVKFHVITR